MELPVLMALMSTHVSVLMTTQASSVREDHLCISKLPHASTMTVKMESALYLQTPRIMYASVPLDSQVSTEGISSSSLICYFIY